MEEKDTGKVVEQEVDNVVDLSERRESKSKKIIDAKKCAIGATVLILIAGGMAFTSKNSRPTEGTKVVNAEDMKIDLESVICEPLKLEDLDENLRPYAEQAIKGGGTRFLEYGGMTYVILSGGEGNNKRLDTSMLRMFNGLTIGYEYAEEEGDSYAIIKTNVNKQNVIVNYGMDDIGLCNMTLQCAVLGVNEDGTEAAIFFEKGGNVTLKIKEGVVLSKGLYELKIDNQEQISEVHKLERISLKTNVYSSDVAEAVKLNCNGSNIEILVEGQLEVGDNKVVTLKYVEGQFYVLGHTN